MTATAGPGGGAARGERASVAPPPIFSSVELEPAATTFPQHSQQPVDAGYCVGLPALIARLSSPDREIVLLRVVAGVSIPDIVAALGVTPAAVCRAEHQALIARQLVASAHGPPLATRQRVVLLPHARTEPPNTGPGNRRRGGGNGMNQDDSQRHHRSQGDGTTGGIAASARWHDAELAMRVARHSFDRWLTADHEGIPSSAMMHAYHTHVALHEVARVISMLIETFRGEAAALITTPVRGTDIPTQGQ
ncbi:MAG TPA: sigma-70 region 4 domain-containing protein [Pseudonocardiaceae bacterium]|nr:sigma-70 region 4 domain-containing protein [Pseudonocardiaceae bacterium]